MFSEAMASRVRQELEQHVPDASNFGGQRPTSIVTGLLAKSNDYAIGMVGHEVFQKVVEYFLTEQAGPFQIGSGMSATVTIQPQLDSTLGSFVHPGGHPQPLHRDDVDRANIQPGAEHYVLGRDTNVTMLSALTATTRANGATQVIPGSHLTWPGDSLFILGSVIHGAGGNSTGATRAKVAVFATRGRLRQMENQFLACDRDKVSTFPSWLQKFMGYSIGQPATGWVDKKDPRRVVSSQGMHFEELWDPSLTAFH
ncbi:Dioxygenase cnsJ [Penicillium hetheringtonii]|uniref:Dioxygenase cnsJ n=1 Tax=Penicillium hetheringtonii TaxID=911720 RepID=A0AAD6GV01_9EURO|nr:Dioxygenase cnsJ [Penicillium hetheringtonii]